MTTVHVGAQSVSGTATFAAALTHTGVHRADWLVNGIATVVAGLTGPTPGELVADGWSEFAAVGNIATIHLGAMGS
jgi:hypothetical protein